MEIEICKAEQSDVPGIVEILRELGWFADITAETTAQTRVHIANQLKLCQVDNSHSVFVARAIGEAVLGYISVHWLPYLIHNGPEGYISELFVRDNARGQGIGSRLLETVEVEGRKRGSGRLILLNMRQRESYERGFYAKHGWEERTQAATFVKMLGDSQ